MQTSTHRRMPWPFVSLEVRALFMLLVVQSVPASPQDAVPAVAAELVRLDAVVTDAKGQIVRGLAKEDFEVREDGKAQPVLHFMPAGPSSRARLTTGTAASPSPAPADPVAVAAAPPGESVRNVVVVVDDLHISGGNLVSARSALLRLVQELVADDDYVALVSTSAGLLHPLTRERVLLGEAVNRITPRDAGAALPSGSRMTAAEAEMILRGDPAALQLVAKAKSEEPGSKFDSMRGATSTRPGEDARPVMGLMEADPGEREAAREAQRHARGVLAEALRHSTATLATVEGALRGLASRPGRKICLLISDGFLVGTGTSEARTQDLQRLIDGATRSGAVVYALDSRGLVGAGGDAGTPGIQGRTTGSVAGLQARVDRQAETLMREPLEQVANSTGGFLVRGTNDLARGLDRMLEDNDAYYLLAYEPSNKKRDGRFRRIEVTLPRHPGHVVRTRKGYLAPLANESGPVNVVDLSAVRPGGAPGPRGASDAEARAILAARLPTQGLPVRLTADFLDVPPEGPQALVRARIDLSGLQWREMAGRQHATVTLVGGFYDSAGKPVGTTFTRRSELSLTPAERDRLLEKGLSLQERVPLPPGRYQVKLVAREVSLGRAGGALEWVEIPDLSDKKLALSGLFVSTSGEDTDTHTRRRFKLGSTLAFQIYVYNPSLDEKGARDVVLQAQIWGGGKVIAASKPAPVVFEKKDGAPLPETNSLPLEGLAAGPYELRVVVVDRKAGLQATRKIDFTIE
jgi:VWFA-related protein